MPLIEVEFEQLQALLAPLLHGAAITSVELVAGGLVNTLYRVTAAKGTYCLRIFAAGQRAWETERNLLTRVAASLPVPEVLLAGDGRADFSHPFLVYHWIEGMTLNECRRQVSSAALLSLAEPLGQLLARVAGCSFADPLAGEPHAVQTEWSSVTTALAANEARLWRGLARERLGPALADALAQRLEETSACLLALDDDEGLAHGDLGGRNILVIPGDAGHWRVSGLIDWENAFPGSRLWDVGSLFRYAKRYSEAFRQRFERGYGEAGGSLPKDWWRSARLLDATRLVATLNEERALPIVFAECRELIEAVVADCG
ncbi:MAG: phosphotransferase family protein [Blastocatellia bacterium]